LIGERTVMFASKMREGTQTVQPSEEWNSAFVIANEALTTRRAGPDLSGPKRFDTQIVIDETWTGGPR